MVLLVVVASAVVLILMVILSAILSSLRLVARSCGRGVAAAIRRTRIASHIPWPTHAAVPPLIVLIYRVGGGLIGSIRMQIRIGIAAAAVVTASSVALVLAVVCHRVDVRLISC
jgi:hypothetical protein